MAAAADSVLIVGAGVIGLACAHYLSRRGHGVTVIDQGTVGGGCSHANCGHICASHVLPLTEPGVVREALASLVNRDAPLRIKPQWRLSMLRWLWQFARRCNRRQMLAAGHHLKAILDSSMREYEALMAAGEVDAEWQRNGLLYVLRSGRGMDRFAANDAMLRDEYGVAARRLEGSELPSFDAALRDGLAGAFHYEGDAAVRPDVFLANWSKTLARHGVRFVEHCRVRRVQSARAKVASLVTDAGEMTADQFVFAAGAWSPQLAADLHCSIPVEPGKGYSLTMTRSAHSPRRPMLFPEHRVAVTPFDDGFRIGSMMELTGFDTTVPPRRIRQLVASASHYLNEPAGPSVRETWYGWRPISSDSLPIIGRVPGLNNAVLATGHHMLGMTMAPATGRLVSEIVAGERPHIDPVPFSPLRFQ